MQKPKFDPKRHHRRSIRLQNYDYSQSGFYFITICTEDRACILGEIIQGEMVLNELGAIVQKAWDTPSNYPNVEMDAFVVMPNHVHGIVWIQESIGAIHHSVGAIHESPLTEPPEHNPYRNERRKMLLSKIVGKFKMVSAKQINIARNSEGIRVWQRNYYEHIIRDEKSYLRILDYIQTNPAKWSCDKFHQL